MDKNKWWKDETISVVTQMSAQDIKDFREEVEAAPPFPVRTIRGMRYDPVRASPSRKATRPDEQKGKEA